MNPCLVLLALAAGCAPGEAVRQPGPTPVVRWEPVAGPGATDAAAEPSPDRWLAEDKAQHFAASFAATSMAYGGGRLALDAPAARAAAAGFALALGVGKELADLHQGSRFSMKDLAWDAAGVTLGYLFAHRIH